MVREASQPRSRRTPCTSAPASAPQGTSTTALPLQLPASHFMFLVDHRALGAYLLRTANRRPEQHPYRNSDAQPDSDVPRQHSSDHAQRRSQHNAPSSRFRFASHNPLQRLAALSGTGETPVPTRAIATLTSLHPPPAAWPSCLQSDALSPATPTAACLRASRTTPAPAPPFLRCRR